MMKTKLGFLRIGAPVSILALAAVFFAFALPLWGGSSVAGVHDSSSVKGVIEWEHRDSAGNVIEIARINNTTLDLIKNDAAARLGVAGTTAPASNDDLYDNISLCSDNVTGGVCTLSTVGNIDETNPQTAAGGAAGATGIYSVARTFTASGAVTVEELQLSKGTVADGTPATTSQIGAWQNVSLTLSGGDTLAITWTITVSGS